MPVTTVQADEKDKRTAYQKLIGEDVTQILNGRKGIRYKPVNKLRVDYWKTQGYTVTPVPKKETDVRLMGMQVNQQGAQQQGDLVLMQAPLEVAERRLRKSIARQKFAEGEYTESVKDEMNRIARNEGRIAAHKDVVIDTSHEGAANEAEAAEDERATQDLLEQSA